MFIFASQKTPQKASQTDKKRSSDGVFRKSPLLPLNDPRLLFHSPEVGTSSSRGRKSSDTAERREKSKSCHSKTESLFANLQDQLNKTGEALIEYYLAESKSATVSLKKQTKNKKFVKKSIVSAGFALFNQEDGSLVNLAQEDGSLVNHYPLSNLYWSSKDEYPKKLAPKKRIQGLARNVCQNGQNPMQHNHSERAFFSHIYTDFKGLLEKAQFPLKKFDCEKHIFVIMMGNTYSSCVHCARFLGGKDETSTSIADIISRELKVILESGTSTHVLVFHQGLESHSQHIKNARNARNANKKQASSSTAEIRKSPLEMRPSSSMTRKILAEVQPKDLFPSNASDSPSNASDSIF